MDLILAFDACLSAACCIILKNKLISTTRSLGFLVVNGRCERYIFMNIPHSQELDTNPRFGLVLLMDK